MIRHLKYLSLFVSAAILYSCSVKKPVATSVTTSTGGIANSYIERYKDLAVSEMRRTGVPASITLAQGMIESDYGRSRLAKEANNHFGIKCHNGWKGPTITHHDDKRNECFRKYRNPEESYYDHSDFLASTSRYKSLFEISVTDYKGWSIGLKKAGYATNPDYSNMLIRKIEENELWRYDLNGKGRSKQPAISNTTKITVPTAEERPADLSYRQSCDNFVVPSHVSRIKENNRIQYIIVNPGDTRESIEKEFNLLRWELARYNDIESDFKIVPGQIIYLQPKRDKAEAGKDTHTVSEGESMYFIAQKYGVKMKKLYELNRMTEGEEPKTGDKIWLRVMKPVR